MAKEHLWDRDNETKSPHPPAHPHPGPKITDMSLPVFMAPDPALAQYPRYTRMAEGLPKVRVETKEHEDELRAKHAAAHKPAKPLTAAEKKAAAKAAKGAGDNQDEQQDENNPDNQE